MATTLNQLRFRLETSPLKVTEEMVSKNGFDGCPQFLMRVSRLDMWESVYIIYMMSPPFQSFGASSLD